MTRLTGNLQLANLPRGEFWSWKSVTDDSVRIAIHVPIRIVGCESPAFGCTCCFGWFMSNSQFKAHVHAAREAERATCPKCGRYLAVSKGKGWNRVRIGGRLAHKECAIDEGKMQAARKLAAKAERKEHRDAVHLAVARGERLP